MVGDVRVHFITIGILSLCVTYFTDATSVTWINNLQGNITRYRRQTAKCGLSSFRCGTGECISEDNECDGREDCPDGSDETTACKSIPCSLFRCNYGACIRKSFECDGKKDCKDNSDETTPKCKNIKPVTRPTVNNCGTGKFQCASGQCIKEEELCDGKSHCDDKSDETAEICLKILCPPFTHRCDYGACVAKTARCNTTQECLDGSDEKNCTNIPTPSTDSPPVIVTPSIKPPPIIEPPPAPGSCLLPHNPQFGEYSVGNLDVYKPGSYVGEFSALLLKCKERFRTTPPEVPNFSVCSKGQWSPAPLKCAHACRSVKSSLSTKVVCSFNGKRLNSCEAPVEGTIAYITCEPLYEEAGLSMNPSRSCKDGSWDFPISQCLPVCGVKRPEGNINVIGGQKARKGDYPWQVGIYNSERKHICGGSIINPRVILSAAHCFANNNDGTLYPKENYLIAAGKYYRTYDDPKDEFSQYSQISAIHVPERYKGVILNYEADIAVVILETTLNISVAVQPVCVDWNNNFEYQQLSENKFGIVVGWGYTVEGEQPSEELKELNVPYISYSDCFARVPVRFRKYLTHDKVCAGYLQNGTAVCEGDSGGGLAFPHFNDKYYIRGIVSTSPASQEGSCDSNQYGTYTLISKHIQFVNDLVTLNRS